MSDFARKYRKMRSQLVQRGLTLRMWARAKKYPVSTVYDAIRGTRHGRQSALIRKDLEAFLND
jgi:gp16 family phage-associated protein